MSTLLFAQSDGTLFVQSDHPEYSHVRMQLLTFSVLIQRMDPIHVYHIRDVSLWQAASMGTTARQLLHLLRRYCAHPIPYPLQTYIVEETAKWGGLILQRAARNRMMLRGSEEAMAVARRLPELLDLAVETRSEGVFFQKSNRADVKRLLAKAGYPVCDRVGYQLAPTVRFQLRDDVNLRPYQKDAVASFFASTQEGSGVIVLPCGAGKTITAIAVMEKLQMHTLILTPSDAAANQWRNELLAKTTLSKDDVSIYAANTDMSAITITTYQRVSAKTRKGVRQHLERLTARPWGIVIYDEVHMLPAPLFRLAADLQGARRLGLTATLIREDGAEADVFSLIGPKCYEVPWKQLELAGFLATVRCVEVRIPLTPDARDDYERATPRTKHRLASLNPKKLEIVDFLVHKHHGEGILIIGHYLESLTQARQRLGCHLISGQTPKEEREEVFERFRRGEIRVLALSRVANMAIDLPTASVAIQLSGLFGSRQEEAQRLGRLLRPSTTEGTFYTLVSESTLEQQMAIHRQLYLLEQGYAYDIQASTDITNEGVGAEHETIGLS